MTFDDLITKLDPGYPDGMLRRAVDALPGRPNEGVPTGEPFADALASELFCSFEEDADDEAQLRLAVDIVDSVVRDFYALRAHAHGLWSPLAEAPVQEA